MKVTKTKTYQTRQTDFALIQPHNLTPDEAWELDEDGWQIGDVCLDEEYDLYIKLAEALTDETGPLCLDCTKASIEHEGQFTSCSQCGEYHCPDRPNPCFCQVCGYPASDGHWHPGGADDTEISTK